MKPDPPIGSIIWGRKYSLKDRTPQIVLLLFLIFVLSVIIGVIFNDESHPSEQNKKDSHGFMG